MRLNYVKTSLLVALLGLGGSSAIAAHTQARLVLDAASARPGDTVTAGIHLQMEPGWHTYWKNPGQEGGLPTTVTWELPAGVTAGNIQWPVPEKVKTADPNIGTQPMAEVVNYVYANEVVLLVPLQLSKDLKPGSLNLKADVSWLECQTKCIPGDAKVQAALEVASETQPSPDKALIAAWQKKLPKSGEGLKARASWEGAASGTTRSLIIEWTSATEVKEADFFPDKSDDFEIQPQMTKLPSAAGTIRLKAKVTKTGENWPKQVSGLLVEKDVAYEVLMPVNASQGGSVAQPMPERSSLWRMLLYAFIGGLILNVMPCVLPVIALKILGFVSEARNEPGHVRKLGVIYTLGVLVSFLILALIIIGLQKAGQGAGWGLQFGNPYFLIAMSVLVMLIALNLFGVFEVTLGSGALTAASTLASKQGSAGAFFNGLLATVLATSCSAPFLGAAVGFASSLKNSLVTILVMMTVGLGLSAPYLILSWNPAWLKFVPKPGQWMNRFKVAMGFPMVAATVWLCSLVRTHYGDRAWWLAMFLIFVAVAAWIYGEFVQRGATHRSIAVLVAAVLLLGGYLYALEHGMRWREPITEATAENGHSTVAPRGIAWNAWSPEAVAAARDAGRPVVVDFTATWCPTCNTIVKPSFENASVQKKLKDINAVALVADYSRRPKAITDELERFQRSGVPLVLIYPRDRDAAPMVFDLVTPSTLLDALDKASK